MMADPKIEKKKRVWPFILLGLGVTVLLVYFLVFRAYQENIVPQPSEFTSTQQTDPISVKENNSTVATYISFVETSKTKLSLDHAYTNEALLKLIEATQAMADEVGYDVQADLEKAKEYGAMIIKAPLEATHANQIRKAGDILTHVLQNIQMAKYPVLSSEVEALKNALESIQPGVHTLDQKNEVKTFFSKAANLLKKMN